MCVTYHYTPRTDYKAAVEESGGFCLGAGPHVSKTSRHKDTDNQHQHEHEHKGNTTRTRMTTVKVLDTGKGIMGRVPLTSPSL